MANRSSWGLSSLLSLALGVYLAILGIQGFVDYTSKGSEFLRGMNSMFGGSNLNSIILLVFSVLEILSGAVLILAPFGILDRGLSSAAFLIIVLFWIVQTIFTLFLWTKPFTPTIMAWLKEFSLNVTILIAIWFVRPSIDRS